MGTLGHFCDTFRHLLFRDSGGEVSEKQYPGVQKVKVFRLTQKLKAHSSKIDNEELSALLMLS